jgi:serine/threonine protein phosphatase PrpC
VHKITGGCTAVVSLFLKNKLFVANAGDSRYSALFLHLIA